MQFLDDGALEITDRRGNSEEGHRAQRMAIRRQWHPRRRERTSAWPRDRYLELALRYWRITRAPPPRRTRSRGWLAHDPQAPAYDAGDQLPRGLRPRRARRARRAV